ncbi:hypothetical protein CBL_09553 [Carabus blaptoides fortunei]
MCASYRFFFTAGLLRRDIMCSATVLKCARSTPDVVVRTMSESTLAVVVVVLFVSEVKQTFRGFCGSNPVAEQRQFSTRLILNSLLDIFLWVCVCVNLAVSELMGVGSGPLKEMSSTAVHVCISIFVSQSVVAWIVDPEAITHTPFRICLRMAKT